MAEDVPEHRAAADRWQKLYGDGGEQFAALIGLMRAHQLTVVRVDAVLKRAGLSRNAFLVLLSLRMSGEMSLGRIGKRVLVHPTTITTVVDQLEQAGLVTRSPHPTDRRTVLAALTAAGDVAIDRVSIELRDAGFGFEGSGPDQLADLTRGVYGITAQHDRNESRSSHA